MAWDDKHKACIIATLATVEAGFNYGIITAPDTLSLGIGQWTQGRAYDLLQQFPDKNVFGPTIRSWLAAGKGTWTMARKYQSLGGTDRQKLSAALASEEGKKIQNNQMRKDLEGEYIPRLKAIGLDSEKYTEAGMLLIVVMHRWGNYARILNRLPAHSRRGLRAARNGAQAVGADLHRARQGARHGHPAVPGGSDQRVRLPR